MWRSCAANAAQPTAFLLAKDIQGAHTQPLRIAFTCPRKLDNQIARGWPSLAIGRTAAKGTSIIPVPYQCKCIGCSPGKHPDTGTMAPGSDDDSRDSVHGSRLCISVWRSERPRRHERQDRRRAPRAVQLSTTEALQIARRRRQTTACCMS